MEAPPMPVLTPEQLQRVSKFLPDIKQIMMAAAYIMNPDMLKYQIDNIDDDQSPRIVTVAIIIAILAAGSVALRLTCRRLMKVAISYDDYLIIVGLVSRTLAKKACEVNS